jgi:hypothetical protein
MTPLIGSTPICSDKYSARQCALRLLDIFLKDEAMPLTVRMYAGSKEPARRRQVECAREMLMLLSERLYNFERNIDKEVMRSYSDPT